MEHTVTTAGQPRLKTNLDTDFIKLAAIISMTIDHVGSVFFPSTRPSGGLEESRSPCFPTA